MKAWMRVLTVSLSNGKKKFVYGEQYLQDKRDYNIVVTGFKYMSALKDVCTIQISNLTYSEIVQLIDGKFYQVEVKAGYRTSGSMTIFKGEVLYISNSLGDNKTHIATILCASSLVARFGQSRLNLSLNSGVNMYSAIRFLCKRAGIKDTNISTQYKKLFNKNIDQVNGTAASWIENLAKNNSSYIVNSDEINGAFVSMYDANRSNARVITLRSDNIILTGGFPRLTKEGLILTMMPTFSFMCGDVIKIDNSIIDISAETQNEVKENRGYYLDEDGLYTIYQIDYTLQNRGPQFSIVLTCKSRHLVSNLLQGVKK